MRFLSLNVLRRWMSKMSKRRQTEDLGKEVKKKKLLSEVARGRLQFLMPDHPDFKSLMRKSYFNFAHEPSTGIPVSLHEELTWALDILRYHGYFYRDWVKVKGQTVQTPISRTLIGEPGTTYKYLGLRLFTIPWSFGHHKPESEVELASETIGKLNEHYKAVSRRLLRKKTAEQTHLKSSPSQEVAPCSSKDRPRERICVEEPKQMTHGLSIEEGTNFNVVLINYMDPEDPDLRLKPEPYYGMGPLAVSWHMDGNLVRGSTVAVYNHTCSSDGGDSTTDSDWMVGFKVSWDIETPGVAIPLQTGESYFMLGDLNDTHQHCVVAGSQARFSTTHRVADCQQGTLSYIQQRCLEALGNLSQLENGEYELKSFQAGHLDFTETVHNEVEFEWLRQFWMQGSRHAAERGGWVPAMECLEADWNKMEHMTKLAVEEANRLGPEEGSVIAEALLPHLKERRKLRQECLDKFPRRLLETIHRDFLPIHRPKWDNDDPSQPLPFDLKGIIRKMRLLCNGKRIKSPSDSESSDTGLHS
ncbi:alpha-ketoglutarate-dependent dioxygenase FTO-like [Acanthaster planci]|uniref:Alpha-ketoglutarate-dependent dioxygenase FTO n=1 Tax=Acanthaster planci TaxID=133434 RepID=A0A8B7YXX6_ACAPL|nr:alpha-ketoglutarate-dependent dioxygenase FTO-like [Acanthaster planci]XP_022097538.1 alpha-ketoglutarate-dependent dioxygenase FTO-like [Acanthaster planci]